MDVYIKVGNARKVGGIVGDNYGTIENCWVSGHVESDHYSADDADLGGIAGLNESSGKIKNCCVTADVKNTDENYGVGGIAGSNEGTIEHVTFYGSVSVDHSQDNKWVGDQDGTFKNYYSSFDQGEYDAASGNDMYRYALMYPYAVNIITAGPGSVKYSVDGVENAPGAHKGQTVTVTKTSGNQILSFSVKDGDGNSVSVSGNEASGWTFSMPGSEVEVNAVFANDDGSLPLASTTRDLEDGKTYKVTENVTINGRLWVNGTARLILGEGATLNACRGIEVSSIWNNANLTIDGPGTLNINECQDGKSGIGAEKVGTITINGGTINVKGGYQGAAIGGDRNNTEGGTITINGGVINATGGDYGVGIGGGYNSSGWFNEYGLCGNITINGGQITAVGGTTLMTGGGAPGMGPGDTSMSSSARNSGTLTLGWKNADDFVYISKLTNIREATFESITFAQDRQFVLEGTSTIATADNMAGKKIVPYISMSGKGTVGDPYTIGSSDDWNAFANYVSNGGMSFSGKFVKLTSDISVTTMVGTSDANSFQGTFDGNSKTLTFTKGTSAEFFNEDYCAPFRHVKGAVIKNLHVDGTIYTGKQKAAGFVAESHGALSITNCRSSVAINSSKSGDGTHGGFVAILSGAGNKITIDGCLFDGSFATTASTGNCGGFVGWPVYNTPTIKNSLMKPSSVAANMLNNTFARWHSTYEPTITNCYFVATDNLPIDQGKQKRTVSAGENVTVSNISPVGSSTATYSVSGITAYAKGISYGGTFYYGNGDEVNVTVANNAPAPGEGQSYIYVASAGTLTGSENPYTLTMPDANVTIGLTTVAADWASAAGTAVDPYKIYNKEQLNMLATRVNNGTSDYSGMYFKLMNDIEYSHTSDWNSTESDEDNYTAIGVSGHAFCGDFNGDGHTISGIRINKGTADYQGLFGLTGTGANIHGIILADARITGADNTGGIVGSNGGTLSDNFIIRTNIVTNSDARGAICGANSGTLQRNYYLSCTVAGTQNASNVYTITANADINVENAGGVIYTKNGLTLYDTGLMYDDVLYAASGEQVSLTLSNNRTLFAASYTASAGTLTNSGNPYTLTMPAGNVNISATWTANAFEGTGTSNDPYLIKKATDWDNFVYYVNSGTVAGFNGKHLKLTNNIEVTTMAGIPTTFTFRGTFDGDGHTITVNYTTAEQYAAPFLNTYGCTIKNLKTAGIINTSSQNAGGVVGRNGTANISLINVSSSVTINSSYVGSGYHGGLVGYAINASFEGCAFTGKLLGASSHHCGGLLGQKLDTGDSNATFTDCLFAPTEVTVNSGMSFTFAAGARNLTSFNNCYYTEKLGGEQGLGYSFDIKPVNIGTEGTPYSVSGITPYTHGLFYNGSYYMTPVAMSLADNADNSTTISDADGHFTTVTLTDRTLYKDGAWNTICLPFDVTLAGSPLAGAEARSLSEASISGTTLNLTFGNALTTLKAGRPYIIKWAADANYVDDDAHNIVSPVFSGVTINATDRSYDNGESDDTQVRFLGTYKYTAFDSEDKSILFLGTGNSLKYPESGASIGAQRAYFKIGEDGAGARQLTAFNIDFGEESTGIGSLNSLTPDPSLGGEGSIYTLDGRKLNGKPSRAGMYIYNGKVVVIK
jgi:hypothetical protein